MNDFNEGTNGSVATTKPPTTSGHQARAAKALAGIFLSIVTLLGITVATTPTPASAAPAYATATVCFQAPYSVYGTTYWGIFDRTVRVDAWLYGGARQITTVTPNTRGCVVMNLVAGYHWRFRVYHYEAATYYVGQTGWQYATAGASYNFGTLRLSTIRG